MAFFFISSRRLQAPACGVDMFAGGPGSGRVLTPAEPAVTTHSLQNLQDLAMMGFTEHKR